MRKGATVLISNVATEELRELYSDAMQVEMVRRKAIGNRAINESSPRELLVVFDSLQRRNFWMRDVFPHLNGSNIGQAAQEPYAWREAAE